MLVLVQRGCCKVREKEKDEERGKVEEDTRHCVLLFLSYRTDTLSSDLYLSHVSRLAGRTDAGES